MSKDDKLRRIEQDLGLARGSVSGGAVPSAPAAPSSGTSGTLSIVGQALGSGEVWIGDSAGLAQEVALSGDATIGTTGVVSIPGARWARSFLLMGG